MLGYHKGVRRDDIYRVFVTFPGEMVVGLGVGEPIGVPVAVLTKVATAALADGNPYDCNEDVTTPLVITVFNWFCKASAVVDIAHGGEKGPREIERLCGRVIDRSMGCVRRCDSGVIS